MAGYHLAQLNVAHSVAPLDSPVMADFMDNLDRINAIAEAAPGYVWRLQTDEGNATSLRLFDDDTLVNMSVWTDAQALKDFMYRTDHMEFLRRRREWFVTPTEPILVLWWIPRGHLPDLAEAGDRLMHLREHGPTAHAFTFRESFPAPE